MIRILVLRAILLCILSLSLAGCDLLTGNQAPVAIIEASPTRGDAPLTVEFDGSRSFDPDGLIVRYEWNFGDGSQAEGPKASHSYTANGIYLAQLTVYDQFGASDRDRVRIVVGNPPPQAIFTASPASGWRPLSVAFDGSASFDPEGDRIKSYEWEFGDGSRASGPRVTHRYDRAGRFTVRLTVTDQDGAESTAMLAIHVLDFTESDKFRLERSPVDVLTDDFDGDELLDLAVVDSESGEVALFFGRAGGGFTRGVSLAAGRRPVALAAADFNGDGWADLAVADLDLGGVWLFINGGRGNFQEPEEIPIGRWASAVTAADLNRDGWLDLVVADAGRDQVVVMIGDGDGHFEVAQRIDVGSWPAALATGDFDRDGLVDVAVVNFFDNSVILLVGDGAGGLFVGSETSVGEGPVDLATADFDGDGRLDLVIANSLSGDLSVLLGSGGGRFEGVSKIPVGQGVRAVAVEDFDGNGFPDVATANGGDDTVTVLLSEVLGPLSLTQARDFPAESGPTALAIGDFDQDGFADIVITHFGGGLISILINQL